MYVSSPVGISVSDLADAITTEAEHELLNDRRLLRACVVSLFVIALFAYDDACHVKLISRNIFHVSGSLCFNLTTRCYEFCHECIILKQSIEKRNVKLDTWHPIQASFVC